MSETEDVARVGSALAPHINALNAAIIAPRVLVAIRAAAAKGFSQGIGVAVTGEAELENDGEVLDAALAALTDHPGGTDK